MDFAHRFRTLRQEVGLTSTALAKPRYTVSYVSQIEAGRRKPSPDALAFFAERLGVSADYLKTGIPDGIEIALRYRLEEFNQQITEGKTDGIEAGLRDLLMEVEQYKLHRLRAQTLVSLGDALRGVGNHREAIDVYEQGLEGDLPERDAGMAVGGLAVAYRSAGDLRYAAEIAESFLARREGGPLDPAVVTNLQSVLVSIYFERGDIIRAERAARRALAAADQNTPPKIRAVAYWHASRVLAETKQWDEALEFATRARVLMEEFDDRRRVARLHNAYAFICLEAEPPRVEEAREHLDIAEQILTEVGKPGDVAYLFTERSRLALLEDEPEQALAHAEQALADQISDDIQMAQSLFMKGRALSALHRPDEADKALQEAADLFGRRGARQQEAACWRELGEIHLQSGDVSSAVEALRSGLAALDPGRSRA
jgi:tetratricopeptide (TPR) repeat protein